MGQPLVDRAITCGATVVVLDRVASADPTIVAQAATLHESGLRVRTLALFYEEWLGKLPVSELERISLMFDIGELHRARYGRTKRVADSVGLVGCVVLVPVLAAVWLVNQAGNRGPCSTARRSGGGTTFTIVKLRTMSAAKARPRGPASTTRGSRPSVAGCAAPTSTSCRRRGTSFGATCPWWVPDPSSPATSRSWPRSCPWYHVRHLVRPGLTGWAQVKYAYGASEQDALEKLQYELYYLRHQGTSLDVRIVGRTLRHVVGLGGR